MPTVQRLTGNEPGQSVLIKGQQKIKVHKYFDIVFTDEVVTVELIEMKPMIEQSHHSAKFMSSLILEYEQRTAVNKLFF